ncbi:MAG: methionyl aminopeptidase [Parcubacteria group bacterium Gr01-1014_20]|nr:MAG: methionyl aminopeptidase [Parcubacteria group bacterium Gr01-1014_20]
MHTLKSASEIEIMAEGGRILATVLKRVRTETKVGVTTKHLDSLSRELIKESGALPAFLGYRSTGSKKPFPATLCVSINEVVVHGQPSKMEIKDGDIVKLDLGLRYRGFYLDSAITVPVGKVPAGASKLISVTKKALDLAIQEAKPGKTLGHIGHAVQSYVEKNEFSVVRSLTGHGIGRGLHEDPSVFNFGKPGTGDEIVVGMVLAIEPMVAMSHPPEGGRIKQLSDDSFAIADGSLSAHFEHTVAVTRYGPRILTIV